MKDPMYPERNLYDLYKKHIQESEFSSKIPDVTKKRTLELMNVAVQCAEDWKYAIDIGGGSGHYSIPLIYKFDSVSLIEPDEMEEHLVLEKKYSNFSVEHAYIENVEITETPNLILLADIFEHIPDINAFIEKLSSLQEKGGIIYILTPNPLFCGPAMRSGISYTRIGSHGHIRHYFKHEIEQLLEKYHYRLVHHSYEESLIRGSIRILVRGISRRDKRWSKNPLYRFASPLIHLALAPFILLLETVVYSQEYSDKNNPERTMSSAFIFKKI